MSEVKNEVKPPYLGYADKSTNEAAKRARARANRKAREEVMKSLGLVKVKGALGGTYWE
jgi:hypothetical protein